MSRMPLIKLGQTWPDGYEDNKYWLGADPMASRVHHGTLVTLGRDCTTIEELESVASDIRNDLDAALAEARKKLGSD